MPNADNPSPAGRAPSKSKKKTKKKKPNTAKTPSNGEGSSTGNEGGLESMMNGDDVEADGEEDEQTPTTAPLVKGDVEQADESPSIRNGVHNLSLDSDSAPKDSTEVSGLAEKVEVLAKERDNLRLEVAELRKSLEDIQGNHKQEIDDLKAKLETAEEGREEADQRHSDLRVRVKEITATLGERLKSNTEEISQANTRIEELEEQNRTIEQNNTELEESIAKLRTQNEQRAREIDSLRGRANLSQQNWVKERDELIRREAVAREEFETANQAMQDWEVLAMEERSLRENLRDKVTELEDQLANLQESYDRVVSERDSQSQTVDGLQRALRDIQEERKRELRELVESSKAQLDEIRSQQQAAEEAAITAKADLERTQKELDRTLPFEKEVKEKVLQIGKLRHEGVILNDHLTKALRFIKQKNPDDMVDRQVVTNHFLHFLTLDRSDPRKFQILQLIAALLGWDDEQKEQAGLTRPGAGPSVASSLRVQLPPFRKVPSTQSLNADTMLMEQRASKESLAELWSDFLEREAGDGSGSSRRPSTASGIAEKALPEVPP